MSQFFITYIFHEPFVNPLSERIFLKWHQNSAYLLIPLFHEHFEVSLYRSYLNLLLQWGFGGGNTGLFHFMPIWSIAFTEYPLCTEKWHSNLWSREVVQFLRDSGLSDTVQAWRMPAAWTLSFTTSWNGDLRKIS